MSEFLALGFLAELLVPLQRLPVARQVVHECDRIKAEVGAGEFPQRAVALNTAALNVVDGRAAERLGRLARVAAVADGPDVGRVVGARGGRDTRVFEQSFLDRDLLVHVGGHQHDVHQALTDDLADDVEELGQVATAKFIARPDLR